MNRNRKIALAVVAGAVVIIAILLSLNGFYVSYLWFKEMGYLNIFFKELVIKLEIGVPVFIVLIIIMYFYLRYLKKLSEKYIGVSGRISSRNEKMTTWVIVALVAFIITKTVADGTWNEVLLSINSSGFGKTDPLYGLDLSFYFFALPLIKALYNVIMTCFVLMVVVTLLYSVYIMYRESNFGFYDVQSIADIGTLIKEIARTFLHMASEQIGIFLGVLMLLLGFGFGVKMMEMVYGGSGMVYGAGASDIAVRQKFYIVDIVACVVFAGVSVWAGKQKKYKMMALGPVVLIALGIGGSVIQSVYEYAVVVPNQYTQESQYIEKNIAATRDAYGLDNVTVKEYAPTQEITAADIQANNTTISNIPINDRQPTKEMYNSLQGIRNYYTFSDVDVDRYNLGGTYTQVFLGAREMNNTALSDDAKTWVNQHLKYTHGFGVAMSPVNKTNSVGQPELIVKDIPPTTSTKGLSVDQPRIYFGEGNYDYCVVGGTNKEFDYPKGDDNQEVTYDGKAGIKLSGINRLSFALYTGSPEMLLSSEIGGDSKILIHRNVMDRVKTIAPFLEYDNDPYMAVVDGKQYWIADAFVKSDKYPYAQPYDDSGNNYIKNPVKVVVDAYNGDVTFYKVDNEPILETYSKIFPGFVKNMSEMPAGLKAHIRYSKTLFDVQSTVYATYHMTNPQVFYNKEDKWNPAKQFFGSSKDEVEIESNYIIMKLPGRQNEFMLTKTFTPQNKDNMIAWLAGVSDGEDYGKLLLYQFPKQELVYGPMQIEQRIDQDTTISPQLTLLGQQGSKVLRGNLMTIPIEQGLIYVEPIYIQASGGQNNLPEVKKVIVCYQNQIVMADGLGDALNQVFGGGAASAGTAAATTTKSTSASDLAKQANDLFKAATDAQKSGDWATYGSKLNDLQNVLSQLTDATK